MRTRPKARISTLVCQGSWALRTRDATGKVLGIRGLDLKITPVDDLQGREPRTVKMKTCETRDASDLTSCNASSRPREVASMPSLGVLLDLSIPFLLQ